MTAITAWAQDVAIRAVKTAAQTAVAALGVNASGLLAINWVEVGSLAGLAAVTCVLQNLASLNLGSTAAVTPVIVTTTSGTVATAPPVFTQTSDAPVPAHVAPVAADTLAPPTAG